MSPDTPDARRRIEGWFPTLATAGYQIQSPISKKYNCIAWAAGKRNKWWEAAEGNAYYWPQGVPEDGSAFTAVRLYEELGYSQDGVNVALEEDVDKVAIYADENGYTHAARQLGNGNWSSKLGAFEDIEHSTLEALCGDGSEQYCRLVCVMRKDRVGKPRTANW